MATRSGATASQKEQHSGPQTRRGGVTTASTAPSSSSAGEAQPTLPAGDVSGGSVPTSNSLQRLSSQLVELDSRIADEAQRAGGGREGTAGEAGGMRGVIESLKGMVAELRTVIDGAKEEPAATGGEGSSRDGSDGEAAEAGGSPAQPGAAAGAKAGPSGSVPSGRKSANGTASVDPMRMKILEQQVHIEILTRQRDEAHVALGEAQRRVRSAQAERDGHRESLASQLEGLQESSAAQAQQIASLERALEAAQTDKERLAQQLASAPGQGGGAYAGDPYEEDDGALINSVALARLQGMGQAHDPRALRLALAEQETAVDDLRARAVHEEQERRRLTLENKRLAAFARPAVPPPGAKAADASAVSSSREFSELLEYLPPQLEALIGEYCHVVAQYDDQRAKGLELAARVRGMVQTTLELAVKRSVELERWAAQQQQQQQQVGGSGGDALALAQSEHSRMRTALFTLLEKLRDCGLVAPQVLGLVEKLERSEPNALVELARLVVVQMQQQQQQVGAQGGPGPRPAEVTWAASDALVWLMHPAAAATARATLQQQQQAAQQQQHQVMHQQQGASPRVPAGALGIPVGSAAFQVPMHHPMAVQHQHPMAVQHQQQQMASPMMTSPPPGSQAAAAAEASFRAHAERLAGAKLSPTQQMQLLQRMMGPTAAHLVQMSAAPASSSAVGQPVAGLSAPAQQQQQQQAWVPLTATPTLHPQAAAEGSPCGPWQGGSSGHRAGHGGGSQHSGAAAAAAEYGVWGGEPSNKRQQTEGGGESAADYEARGGGGGGGGLPATPQVGGQPAAAAAGGATAQEKVGAVAPAAAAGPGHQAEEAMSQGGGRSLSTGGKNGSGGQRSSASTGKGGSGNDKQADLANVALNLLGGTSPSR